jgi:putative ATP-dependent endonuclease of the OLD family
MKAVEVKIHNYRAICDATITLEDCAVLVGVNNSGKTTVIDAIRTFYGKIKYDVEHDFPRSGATDKDTWVEIEFRPSTDEFLLLKADYQSPTGTFRVRNYFSSEQRDGDGKAKAGPYAYVNGVLSNERFYGFKNVGQGKFGEIIYIPAVSRIDDHTKLTGPSALRDLVNNMLSSLVQQSSAYRTLNTAFVQFESAIKTEETSEGRSIEGLEHDISEELAGWGAEFRLNIRPVGVDQIVKDLIGHEIFDPALNAAEPVGRFGQGFQRRVIYTLIRIAAKYGEKKVDANKKEFSPELNWILFEEPEAFLHPTQIGVLSSDLRALSRNPSSQVLLSTHSPAFVTQSIRNIPAICRLQKDKGQTAAFQVSSTALNQILTSNQQDLASWQSAGLDIDADDLQTDMEAVKYALWLDSKRSAAFFAERVLLVEGPSETALLSYMFDQELLNPCRGVFFLDTIGKYNMHRFMNLFGTFGIKHYVLLDGDNGRNAVVDATINGSKNQFTCGIDAFPSDLEDFLGVQKNKSKHRKPQHLMYEVGSKNIDLTLLAEKVNRLVSL